MKQLQIESLRLLNFKGGSLTINFNKITNIEGANGSGKTRVFDAFTWLLFGKNSQGESVFNIKNLDENNNPIHRLSHEVEGKLIIDGFPLILKRVYKEDWVRQRGSESEALKGHTTTYFIDDVAVSAGEYERRVGSICSEAEFKLITSPLAFPALHWEKQRQMLFSMAGELNPVVVCVGKNDFLDLLERMGGKKSKEYADTVRAQITKCKEELEKIKPAIEEVIRMTPAEQNWKSLEDLVKSKEKDLQTISGQLSSFTDQVNERNGKVLELSDKILALKQKLSELVALDKDKALQQYHNDLNEYRVNNAALQLSVQQLEKAKKEKASNEEAISVIKEKITELKAAYISIDSEQLNYNEDDFSCKVCGARFDIDKISEMQEHTKAEFNKSKAERLFANVEAGKKLVEQRKGLEARQIELIDIIDKEGEGASALSAKNIEPVSPVYEYQPDQEYKDAEAEIERLKEEQGQGIDLTEQSILKNQLSDTLAEITDLNKTLNDKSTIKKNNDRIEELKASEKALNQALAEHEKEEKVLFDYSKFMTEYVESRVSSMFEIVKFKLFTQQLNGGETPTCQAMVNGVPFSDLNNAMKIGAGIDIIKALQKHMNTSAPIFIDNRESVTEIPAIDCQIINLIVNENEKTLKIS